METVLKLQLTGTRDMLFHNERLRNPLDSYTRRLSAITAKQKKTDQDHSEIAQLEARGGMYETLDGLLGLPSTNVWSCIQVAARKFKLGKAIAQALQVNPIVVPLLIDGKEHLCDTYLNTDGHLDYRSAVVSGKRVMRARAKVPAGWEATVEFILLDDVLQVEKLQPVLEHAGRLIGLCDWRPIYGLFSVKIG